MSKKTVIVGATTHSYRYAFLAAQKLTAHQHEIVPLGIRKGTVADQEILDIRSHPEINEVDTITLYISPEHQIAHEDYLISLSPNRIIFNPGTTNASLESKAREKGIETLQACTLVMLSANQY